MRRDETLLRGYYTTQVLLDCRTSRLRPINDGRQIAVKGGFLLIWVVSEHSRTAAFGQKRTLRDLYQSPFQLGFNYISPQFNLAQIEHIFPHDLPHFGVCSLIEAFIFYLSKEFASFSSYLRLYLARRDKHITHILFRIL